MKEIEDQSQTTETTAATTLQEEPIEDLEVASDSTSVASSKGKRVIVLSVMIVISAIFMYILIFKGSNTKTETNAKKLGEIVKSEGNGSAPPRTNEPTPPALTQSQQIEQPLDSKNYELPSLPELPNLTPEQIASGQTTAQNQSAPQGNNAMNGFPDGAFIPPSNNQIPFSSNGFGGGNKSVGKDGQPIDPMQARKSTATLFMSGTGGPSSSIGFNQGIITSNIGGVESLAESSASSVKATRIKDVYVTIAQGKMIDTVLETAINSDLPGSVRAVISRDVYSEAGRNILIPKGSRIVGKYASNVSRGQKRVMIIWDRVVRPDGVDIAINSPTTDQFGRTGVEGEVDNRYSEIFSSSILTSILSIGAAIAVESITNSKGITQSQNTTGTQTGGKASDFAISDATKSLTDTASSITKGLVNTSPTITIPQGTRVNVFVNHDLIVPVAKVSIIN